MRASSGMIGTTRLPMPGSRNRLRSKRANAVVVDACTFSPVPATKSAYALAGGSCSVLGRTTRSGIGPSSVRRRAWRYSYCGESVPGW